MKIVVGSGPSAWAASKALREKGEPHTILDCGIRTGKLRLNGQASAAVALKTFMGSDHMYAEPEGLGIKRDNHPALPLSSAHGGLSTVWGTGLQVLPRSEYAHWLPEGLDLDNSYRALLRDIPHVFGHDRIDQRFPWPNIFKSAQVPQTQFFESFLDAAELRELNGVLIGSPRLALDLTKCVKCGQCLNGCAYGALFDSGRHFDNYLESDLISFVTGTVQKIGVNGERALVHYTTQTGLNETLNASEVILCAGVIGTAAILLRSNILSEDIVIQDSQVFYTLFRGARQSRTFDTEFPLAQAYVTADKASRSDFHLSLYPASLDTHRRFKREVRDRLRIPVPVPRIVTDRIVSGIGFLTPDVSGRLRVRNTNGSIVIERESNPEAAVAMKNVVMKVSQQMKQLGLKRIPAGSMLGLPGAGFHSGSSLPLNSEFVDHAGRVRNSPQIRIGDPSILPRLPAGPHTLTSMALIHHLLRGD
jgi:ferredoxin